MISRTIPSWPVSIFIAGDYDQARAICREFCDEAGLCVTVTATCYVYTGGEEAGVIIGLINYPRFPSGSTEISAKAFRLAALLCEGLGQQSYSIQTPDATTWHSHRPEDNEGSAA
ncbi:MAG: hypothetical protein V4696_00835 [Pseudomonadota bacterium]